MLRYDESAFQQRTHCKRYKTRLYMGNALLYGVTVKKILAHSGIK